jgi:ubiquinone/menaquinone biosynthesis C-methylase UbiE
MEPDTVQTGPAERMRQAYAQARREHWNATARQMAARRGWGGYYHRRLETIYRHLVPPGSRVLELGCGTGDLLAALQPGVGVGVDFSPEMIAGARQRHPDLTFIQADAHDLAIGGTFDVIILSDLLNDLWDVQGVLQGLSRLAAPKTRVILNSYSRLWELPLALAEKLGLARPNLHQNWLTVKMLPTCSTCPVSR